MNNSLIFYHIPLTVSLYNFLTTSGKVSKIFTGEKVAEKEKACSNFM